jgi:hypothetical protein
VTFACPSQPCDQPFWPATDWQTGLRYGYYSVMLASSSAGAPLTADTAAAVTVTAEDTSTTKGKHPGEYPATEQQVFTWREGAFYGDVFAPSASKYACFSDIWSDPDAYMEGRLCAGLPVCDITTAGACKDLPQMYDASPPSPNQRCATADGPECPGAGNYEDCVDRTVTTPPYNPAWHRPVTVYLNHPCDLSLSRTDPKCQVPDPEASCLPPDGGAADASAADAGAADAGAADAGPDACP